MTLFSYIKSYKTRNKFLLYPQMYCIFQKSLRILFFFESIYSYFYNQILEVTKLIKNLTSSKLLEIFTLLLSQIYTIIQIYLAVIIVWQLIELLAKFLGYLILKDICKLVQVVIIIQISNKYMPDVCNKYVHGKHTINIYYQAISQVELAYNL